MTVAQESTFMVAQAVGLLANQVASELNAIATAGSMLESADSDRGEYITQDQHEVVGSVRELGRMASGLGNQMLEMSNRGDFTLREAFDAAKIKSPEDVDWLILKTAATWLLETGELLRDWKFENPNWERWRELGKKAAKLGQVAVGVGTIALVAFVGPQATATVPFLVITAGYQIASAII